MQKSYSEFGLDELYETSWYWYNSERIDVNEIGIGITEDC